MIYPCLPTVRCGSDVSQTPPPQHADPRDAPTTSLMQAGIKVTWKPGMEGKKHLPSMNMWSQLYVNKKQILLRILLDF